MSAVETGAEDSLHCSYPTRVHTFDPTRAKSGPERQFGRLVCRQLFVHRGDTNIRSWRAVEPVADLAAEVPSTYNMGLGASHRAHVVHLRPGVQWGLAVPRQVTAADVLRGFQRACAPGHEAPSLAMLTDTIRGLAEFRASVDAELAPDASARDFAQFCRATPIEGIIVLNENTLIVEAKRPTLEFVNLLTLPEIAPTPAEHEAFLPGQVDDLTSWCSNGPFRVVQHDHGWHGRDIRVLARNGAWDPETDPVRTTNARTFTFTFGAEHGAEARSEAQHLGIRSYRESHGPNRAREPADQQPVAWAVGGYLVFNHSGGRLSDRADRAMVGNTLAAAQRARLGHGFPPLSGDALYPLRGDGPGAEQTDTYPVGEPIIEAAVTRQLVALTPVGELAELAEACWQELEAAGWKVDRLTTADADKAGAIREWDMTVDSWVPSWLQHHERDLYQRLFSGDSPANIGRYRSDHCDRLIQAATATVDPRQAARLWSQVSAWLVEDCAFIPLLVRPLGSVWELDPAVRSPLLPTLDLRPDLAQASFSSA